MSSLSTPVLIAGIAVSVLVVTGVTIYAINEGFDNDNDNGNDSDSDNEGGGGGGGNGGGGGGGPDDSDDDLPVCDDSCTTEDLGYFGGDTYQA